MDTLGGRPAVVQPLAESSASVQAHLGLIQSVINRMATNSASCKTWCVTLVAAILVVVAEQSAPRLAYLALFPVVVFLALDTYYLALEKGFRASYNDFVDRLHGGHAFPRDLYAVEPTGNASALQKAAFRSFSVWGFYLSLAVLVWIAERVVIAG